MHNVFKGIIVGFIGFVIWMGVSIIYGIVQGLGGGENAIFDAFMYLGFFIMIGGPLVYIIILPVWGWWRRTREADGKPTIKKAAP